MQKVDVLFSWLDPEGSGDLQLPHYASELAAGMDVAAAVPEPVSIDPGEIKLIPTGFAVALPPNYELQVRPRSGLAVKYGISIINAPGTIDADYRGEIKIGLVNLGRNRYSVERGARIAQLILAPVCRAKLQVVASLEQTVRGTGGFGHTGV
ncbi:MAG: dUTP diphosphatase [Desulfobulbaceae bacterium]|nr:dUTP diphosphatase [Desulfobulbaceae bacterium]